MKHEDWMSLALAQARLAFNQDEVPVGAVIVRDGELLSLAHNEKEKRRDPTAHAEILAVQRAVEKIGNWRLTEAVLYVTLEPCPMCAGALLQSRIKGLVYGAADPKAGSVESVMNVLQNRLWNHEIEVTAGVLEIECQTLLKIFFARKR